MTRNHVFTEAIAGVTTFLTMSYIVVVNPGILSTPGTGMNFQGVLTATVIVCFTMTLLMGLYAKLPFAVAPGMGINAFFTFSIIIGRKVPWPTALGMIFWAGVLFLLISATPIRESIARGLPPSLRIAAAAGIGVFLTFIGLRNAGIVVADPATLVKLGPLGAPAWLVMGGAVITVWLLNRKSPLAFLGGIAAVTAAAVAMGLAKLPEHLLSAPDFSSVLLKLDIMGALKLSLLPATISILFTDLFDSISTFVGVSYATGLTDDEGHALNLRQGLIVDALATLGAGLAGTSSGTAYIESAAGIEMGGRTGLTSVFTALCFLPCLFVGPLAASVPPFATAPVLILVGALMFRSVARLPMERLEDAIPAFLTIVLIPLTFSITQGILWGFLSHAILYVIAGRGREVKPVMYVLAVVAAALLLLEHGA
jgi:AGZA family xanthine/uracil permease-like MFS transporter